MPFDSKDRATRRNIIHHFAHILTHSSQGRYRDAARFVDGGPFECRRKQSDRRSDRNSACAHNSKSGQRSYQTTWVDIQPIRNLLECGLVDYIGLASFAVDSVDSSLAFIRVVNNLFADGPGSISGLLRRPQAFPLHSKP